MTVTISYSIRNKSKSPIVTYSKKTMELFLKTRPETVSLVLNYHSNVYKHLTGKSISIDHDQSQILKEYFGWKDNIWHAKTGDLPYDLWKVNSFFVSGILSTTTGHTLEDVFKVSETFYNMLFSMDTVNAT